MPASDPKLTAAVVREIRARIDPIRRERMKLERAERLAMASFAVSLKVHIRTVRKVVNRERWKGVK